MAYLSQRPFIQNSTLRDNITFGLATRAITGGGVGAGAGAVTGAGSGLGPGPGQEAGAGDGIGGRYQRVLEECALLPDLQVRLWPAYLTRPRTT